MLQTKIQLFLCLWVNADCWQLWMKWGKSIGVLNNYCVCGGVSVSVSMQVYMLVCMCACRGQRTTLDITRKAFFHPFVLLFVQMGSLNFLELTK